MESEDLHYHLQQQHEDHHHHHHVGFVPSSSSSPSSDTYGVHENNHHSWTPNTILSSETLGSSTVTSQRNEIFHDPSFNNCPMTQHMEFNWATNSQIPEAKQELSLLNHDLFPKLTDLLNSPSSIQDLRLGPSLHMKIKNDHDDQQEVVGNEYLSELSQKLMLKTLSSSSSHMMMMMYGSQRAQVGEDYGGSCGAASGENHISQIIHPSINVSSLSNINGQSSSPSGITSMSSSDFLHPSRSISQDGLGLIGERSPNNLHTYDYSRDRMSALSNSKTSEAKRSNSSNMDVKGPLPPKKSRLESRASCPPIKVRKEKLGERIAALQQLVAPFGKTDTASVLMEAIGYIKFLQNQVQALSVPYMKHSRSEAINRSTHMVTRDDGNERPKRDLRSRGLCLVPLSCMSFVMTNDGSGGGGGCGGGIWPPPPNFTHGR